MWAVAEITWEDGGGTSFRVPAILEDTSKCGACIRLKRPVAIGSRLTIKWHREEFSAIARNCRRDGGDFLLGVRREHGISTRKAAAPPTPSDSAKQTEAAVAANQRTAAPPVPALASSLRIPVSKSARSEPSTQAQRLPPVSAVPAASHARTAIHTPGTSPRPERKVMEPKTIFPHFWRRKQDGPKQDEGAPTKSRVMEAPVNKSSQSEPTPSGPRGELLGYDDIYRASGIMSPGGGYGIHKIVDMLNSDRLRDLSSDAKRASVLMALDAAGISPDELLTDATRRQNALTAYEASQVKQLEDFEARKAKDNCKIEEEMEKIRAHYAQRVQSNLDQVAKEKEALHSWQMAMQHETQRIAEVIELCGKQPVPAQKGNAMAAAAGAQAAEKTEAAPAQPATGSPVRPTLSGH